MSITHSFTLRPTWPDKAEDDDDFVFRCDGIDAGRCYLLKMAGGEQRWHWTIFLGTHVTRVVQGVSVVGDEVTLDDAKSAFRQSFAKMIAAGVVHFP